MTKDDKTGSGAPDPERVASFLDDERAFESFCARHPERAEAMRKLRAQWQVVMGLAARDGESNSPTMPLDESLGAALRERFGEDVDPGITLEPPGRSGEASDFSAEFLRRLGERPDTSGRYRLRGEVAKGGQGAVLHVWDDELRRNLAMKVTLGRVPEKADDARARGARAADAANVGDAPDLDAPRAESTPPVTRHQVARFLEEALVTGQLDHPGVVPVHELGLDPTGRVFFTMKLVRGEDLRAVLARVHRNEPDWTVPRALGLLLRACEAMAYAHDKHVIHRDLKPGNIMVGRFGEVYVMDWGLARVLGRPDARNLRLRPDVEATASLHSERHEQASEDSPLVTMDGDIVGTPAYMPPEQARGAIDELSPASDVYALGAILYHLVSGRMPYVVEGGNNAPRRMLARIEEGPPKPLHEVAPDAPVELVAICEHAMAREPDERYASVVELADDLRAYLEQRVVKAYETGAVAELRKWVVRNRPLAAAIGAVVVLLVATVVLVYRIKSQALEEMTSQELHSQNEQLERARDVADERLVEAERERDRAHGRSLLALAEMDFSDDAAMRAMILRELPDMSDAFVETRAMTSTKRGNFHRAATLRGHGGRVRCASWSPDGTRIVTASDDGTARVWNADGTGVPIVLPWPAGPVMSASWSPDGTQIVTAADDDTVLVWNADGTGTPIVIRRNENSIPSATRVDGNEIGVHLAVWSPDGARIVIASGDRTARVRNADGTDNPIVLLEHESPVTTAAWSPDGTRIVTASDDGTARVWNADGTGEPLVLLGHERSVTTAAWSPDGTQIVTASGDGTARVWRADGTDEPLVVLRHVSSVLSAAWSPDGTQIVTTSSPSTLSTSEDGTVRVWNADGSGKPLVLRGREESVGVAAWSPDGTRIVSASDDGTARVCSADGLGDPLVLRGHEAMILSCAWSPDGTQIVTASSDGTARVWNTDGADERFVLRGHQKSVSSAAWSRDGMRLVTASDDHSARVWSTHDDADPTVLRGHEDWVRSAAWSPDGTQIATASFDETARMWSADGTGETLVLRGHEGLVYSVAWSPDGMQIATASHDGTARVWSSDGTAKPIVLRGHMGSVNTAAWSPDGTQIVTASDDGTALVWNADNSGRPIALSEHTDVLNSATWSPDGTQILTASDDGTARVWRADGTGKPTVLHGHKEPVNSAAWSPDGALIVTASSDDTARVWNADGTGESLVLRGHGGSVNTAAWSADGTRIVTASDDGTARVWNAHGSGEPLVLHGHERGVNAAAWSPDGTRIVTTSWDDTARIWIVDWPTLRARLWDVIPDLLTPEERVRYLDEPGDVARATYAQQKVQRDARVLERASAAKR